MYYVLVSNNETPTADELRATTHLVGCFSNAQEAKWSASSMAQARGFAWAHIIDEDATLIETISSSTNPLGDELAAIFAK